MSKNVLLEMHINNCPAKNQWLNFSLTDFKIFGKLSPERMHTRVQPQSLLDHLLQVLHLLKVTKRRIACRIAEYLFQFINSFLLHAQFIKNINSTAVVDL